MTEIRISIPPDFEKLLTRVNIKLEHIEKRRRDVELEIQKYKKYVKKYKKYVQKYKQMLSDEKMNVKFMKELCTYLSKNGHDFQQYFVCHSQYLSFMEYIQI